jgi:hypothetical protein
MENVAPHQRVNCSHFCRPYSLFYKNIGVATEGKYIRYGKVDKPISIYRVTCFAPGRS